LSIFAQCIGHLCRLYYIKITYYSAKIHTTTSVFFYFSKINFYNCAQNPSSIIHSLTAIKLEKDLKSTILTCQHRILRLSTVYPCTLTVKPVSLHKQKRYVKMQLLHCTENIMPKYAKLCLMGSKHNTNTHLFKEISQYAQLCLKKKYPNMHNYT